MWELSNIAMISHASKIFLRIIQKRLEHFLIPEPPTEQISFKKEEEQDII